MFFFASIPEDIPLHFGTWHFLWRDFPTNRWFWCLDTTDINGWHPSFPFSKQRWHTRSEGLTNSKFVWYHAVGYEKMAWKCNLHSWSRKSPPKTPWQVMAETDLTRFLKAGPCLGGNGASFGHQVGGGASCIMTWCFRDNLDVNPKNNTGVRDSTQLYNFLQSICSPLTF